MASKVDVCFTKPTIGPRAYVVAGPSGWAETFARKEADHALTVFLGRVPLTNAIEGYRRQRYNDGTFHYDWTSIVDYLAGLIGGDRKRFPHEVGVAFWANLLLDDEKKTKPKTN